MRAVAHLPRLVGVIVAGCVLLACDRGSDRQRDVAVGLQRDSMLAELASAPPPPVVPPEVIRAALDSVYRVMQAAARASVASQAGRDETIALLRREISRLSNSVVALRDTLYVMRRSNYSFGDTARTNELALVQSRSAAMQERFQKLLAEKDSRFDTLTAQAGALRDSLASARGDNARLAQQIEGFASELGAARDAMGALQSEVTTLNQRVEVLDGDAHRVAVCVGTGEELRAHGIAERRGGVRGVLATWTVRRGANFDECRDRFDWRERRTVARLPARRGDDTRRYEVLSAHDPSLLRLVEVGDSRRYGLVVDEAERFWSAGPVLVVRLR